MKKLKLGTAIFLVGITYYTAGQTASVVAIVETDPVTHTGDAADDPAIWIHPTNPTLSTIIGTDKKGGLVVYDLAGTQLQYLPDGNMNNVNVRYKFPLAGELVDLVTAGNRSNDSIGIYRVNPATRMLENASNTTVGVGITVYGSCMYRSASSGQFYFFVNSKDGDVEQWRLFDDGTGEVTGVLERSFDVGTQTEGCVADDELANLYIGEEDVGIWKYGAEPQDGSARTQVDSVGSSGNLTADVEGLTLYYSSQGKGYLIASSQGADEYVIYEREGNNSYAGTFDIVGGTTIDGVSGTDGIDVTNFPLDTNFPNGVFVAQDGQNAGGNQNYKLVPWQDIALAVSPNLAIDITFDPRIIPTIHPRPPTGLSVE